MWPIMTVCSLTNSTSIKVRSLRFFDTNQEEDLLMDWVLRRISYVIPCNINVP